MSPRRVLAMLRKDLRDAWRDGRIVLLLLMPIGIALIPSISGGGELPTAVVAIAGDREGAVARELSRVVAGSSAITVRPVGDAASARALVERDDVDLAIVVARLSAASPPAADVLVSAAAPPSAQSVVALVPDALTRAAGRPQPAQTQVSVIGPADERPIDVIDPEAFTLVMSILLLATFVAMMVVPIQTAEELETGTFGALRLAATGAEILAAKALAGYAYGAAGIGLVVALTSPSLSDAWLFWGAALALVVSLVGFGLLMGLLVTNTNAINTYGGFLLVPLIGAAAAVFFVDSGIAAGILAVLPFSQAAKLLADGVSAPPPFAAGAAAWAVIGAWALVGYGLLARIARRREL